MLPASEGGLHQHWGPEPLQVEVAWESQDGIRVGGCLAALPITPNLSSVSPAQGWSLVASALFSVPSSVTFLVFSPLWAQNCHYKGQYHSESVVLRGLHFGPPPTWGHGCSCSLCRPGWAGGGVESLLPALGTECRHLTESWYLSVQGCRRQACLLGWDSWALKLQVTFKQNRNQSK